MFEVSNFSYIRYIHPFEWAILSFYVLLILVISFWIQHARIKKEPIFRYYTVGVMAKLLSSVIFCVVYIYYYNGGDTVSYYETARALVNLGLKDFGSLFKVLTEKASLENYFLFDDRTGYPWPYMYYDSQTFFVAKLVFPILLLSFKSYLVSSVVLSWVAFFGVWKLFRKVTEYYPGIENKLSFAILFLPSALFWGSGILKDTITFSAVCWFIYAFESFLNQKKKIKFLLVLIISAYVLLSIKPYILIALFPGTLIWFFHERIARVKSRFIRYVSIPMIYFLAFAIGFFVLNALGDSLGKFSVDRMLVTASVTQKDLKQDYYQGSSFDIGDFDPTIQGVASKVPAAMVVGMFRPFIWEARNAVMLASGLENAVFLILALLAIFRFLKGPGIFFKLIFDNPLILFMLSYSMIFAVLVGLSTSNFGALVRFKLPFLSVFVCVLVILYELFNKKSHLLGKNQRFR
ncbi:MAG: hypothetical protein Fur0041_03280 [Bacteroidia bacterium]